AKVDCSHPAGVAIRRFVPFKNRFGETIAVDLYEPTGPDGVALTKRGCRFPVMLESSPYRDWTNPQPTKVDGADDARRSWWVHRGYVYAFADVPGTGGSDGTWCLWCRHEQLSGVDIVNALGSARWSNGNVGMIGGSYPAINALLIAQHRPKHLKAVIAAAFLTDPYTDFFFVDGMERLEDAKSLMAAFTALSRWTGRWTPPTSETEVARFLEVWGARETAPLVDFMSIQSAHPTRDSWYEERTVHPERINVPVYMLGGWNDIFDRSTWRMYDRLASKSKVLVQGPFTHVPLFVPADSWPCESQNADFCGGPFADRFLKGRDSLAYRSMISKPVRTYIQPGGYTTKAAYASWPSKPKTSPLTLTLGKKGAKGTVTYQPLAGLTSGRSFYRGSVPGDQLPYDAYIGVDNAQDQRLEEATSLSLQSPVLKSDVTMLGGASLKLRVTPSSVDADVVVRVVDSYPQGSAFPAGYGYLVTSGWLKASHRSGHTKGAIRPLEPGKPVDLAVDIWPAGYRFAKGHRIRIDIYPADVPRFMPPTTPVDLSIDLAASRVALPTLERVKPMLLD
ncbi:MAG: CocE/NonD family hydrolase, partial [Actinomycetota bacterium]